MLEGIAKLTWSRNPKRGIWTIEGTTKNYLEELGLAEIGAKLAGYDGSEESQILFRTT